MLKKSRLYKKCILIITFLSLTACVNVMQRPEVSGLKPTLIYAENYVPNKWNLPIGSVISTESNLAYRKYPESSDVIKRGILFGALGALVADKSLSADSRTAARGIDSFTELNLQKIANHILEDTQTTGYMPKLLYYNRNDIGNEAYKLHPFVYLETDGVKRSDLMVVLRVVNSRGTWTGQYVSHIYGLVELGSIRYSKKLEASITSALKQSLLVFYQDIQGKIVKSQSRIVLGAKNSMFYSEPEQIGWEMTSSDKELFIFQPKADNKVVFGGLQIYKVTDVITESY